MKYIVQDSQGNKSYLNVVSAIPVLPEGFQLLGKAEDLPEVVAEMEAEKLATQAVTDLYNQMNADVYAQMTLVFGTTNPDSASANEKTWTLMQSNPGLFANQGLKDDNGVVMSTEQQVLDYASAKMTAVLNYGIWRLQRIQQFRDARDAIINEN